MYLIRNREIKAFLNKHNHNNSSSSSTNNNSMLLQFSKIIIISFARFTNNSRFKEF